MAHIGQYLTGKVRRALAEWPYVLRAMRMVWQIAPRHTAGWSGLLLLGGLLPVASVYLLRDLVDTLTGALAGDGAGYRAAGILVVSLGAVFLLIEVLRVSAEYVRATMSDVVTDEVKAMIYSRAVLLDLAAYEDPAFFDTLHQAHNRASYELMALTDSAGSFLRAAVTLVAMAAVLVPYAWWLPIVLIASTLPAFYAVMKMAIVQHRHWQDTTQRERRAWYYEALISDPIPAAEIRIFGLGDYVLHAFRGLRGEIRVERRQVERRRAMVELLAGCAALLALAAVMLWMALQLRHRALGLGDLALFYQAFYYGQGVARQVLQNIAHIYKNSLYLRALMAILDAEPAIVAPPAPQPISARLAQGYRLEGVHFTYPGSRRSVYAGLDLDLPAGQITVIMGSNGAGKSTLIKLLCRFYDPDQGRILMDGTDLRQFDPTALRSHITTLAQTPFHFNETVRQNIAFGDMAAATDDARIHAAAQAAAADELIAELPDGYDTLLGRSYKDGAELSGGQWQRLALARAFLSDAPIIILDEPTSAMDSWAEADWLDRLRGLAAGRTCVLITHRLAPTSIADRIIVMDHGRVAESGTHAELLTQDGRYAESWRRLMRDSG